MIPWLGWFEELGCGFSLGFGVGWGGWFVLEGVGKTGDREGFGFGLNDRASRLGDTLKRLGGLFEPR